MKLDPRAIQLHGKSRAANTTLLQLFLESKELHTKLAASRVYL
jgi:hypothetical protein